MRVLKFVFIILVFSAASSFANDNIFKSVTVGIEVRKPNDWSFITTEENMENLKRIKLNDADFQRLMQKYATAPLVAMMKYPEPFDDLNPSFNVKIKLLGQLKGIDAKQIISLILPQFKKMFKDYKMIQEPTDTEVSGVKAAYTRFNYSLQIPDGRIFPASSEVWIVPRNDYFFIVGAGTRQDEKTGSRNEIKAILNSLKIEKYAVNKANAADPKSRAAD
jgi:hypothetical protein